MDLLSKENNRRTFLEKKNHYKLKNIPLRLYNKKEGYE